MGTLGRQAGTNILQQSDGQTQAVLVPMPEARGPRAISMLSRAQLPGLWSHPALAVRPSHSKNLPVAEGKGTP